MKNWFPRPHEMGVFAMMALICTLVVVLTGKYAAGLALLGGPLFLVASLMGLRRSEMFDAQKKSVSDSGDAGA